MSVTAKILVVAGAVAGRTSGADLQTLLWWWSWWINL